MGVINAMYRLRGNAALLAVVGLLAAAPMAYGQQVGPPDDQYGTTLELISQGEREQPPAPGPDQPPTADRAVGGLPFTGIELGALLATAIALGGAGLLLRRLARERSATGGGTA